MNVEDQERQPLLAGQRDGGDATGSSQASTGSRANLQSILDTIKDRWQVYQILAVVLLMYTCNVGPYAVLIELSRALSCAEYYERFPDAAKEQDGQLLTVGGGANRDGVCDNAWVERNSARAISTMEISGSLCATLAIFLIQPRMQRWGPKRVLLISLALFLFDRTANLFWPLGYPFRPLDSPMPLSAITVRRLFIVVTCLANMAGGEMVPLMCLRLILTKVSTAGDRTRNLVSLQLMNLLSISIAPSLTVWLGSLFPFSSTRMDQILFRFGHYLQRLRSRNVAAAVASLFTTSTPPIITPPSQRAEPTNIAPYLVSLLTVIITLISAAYLLPSEERRQEADLRSTDVNAETKKTNRESMFYRVWPRRDVDGKLDWRILIICLSIMSHLATAYALNIFLQFFGHALHWGQESVAGLVSALGVTRIVCLLGIVPLATAYYERTTRRSTVLQGLTLDQIKSIAEHAPADEPPIESAFEAQGDRSDELRGAVSSWQAYVDRGVLHFSLVSDVIGWFLTAVFTTTGNAAMIAVSGCVSALGAASIPVRMSVDLVIIGDVLARTVESSDSVARSDTLDDSTDSQQLPAHQDQAYAHELYFALVGFFGSFATFLTPILYTWLYGMTLDTFPAANWLLACGFYALTYLLHFSMPVHRRSSCR